jgi:hypothetical protein
MVPTDLDVQIPILFPLGDAVVNSLIKKAVVLQSYRDHMLKLVKYDDKRKLLDDPKFVSAIEIKYAKTYNELENNTGYLLILKSECIPPPTTLPPSSKCA